MSKFHLYYSDWIYFTVLGIMLTNTFLMIFLIGDF